MSLVRDTPCPRWHVDKVRLRGSLTLVGPGVEVAVAGRVERLAEGQAVLIPGAEVDARASDCAVWHRSPRVDRDVRLVLQTDCFED